MFEERWPGVSSDYPAETVRMLRDLALQWYSAGMADSEVVVEGLRHRVNASP